MAISNFDYDGAYLYMKSILKQSRFEHCLRVSQLAGELAEKYGEDVEKAKTAGLFHDIKKHVSYDEAYAVLTKLGVTEKILLELAPLSHGLIGAELLKNQFGLDDAKIYDAIANHTFGRLEMSLFEKIVYIADNLERGREFEGREKLEKLAFEDIERAYFEVNKNTLLYLLQNNRKINPILVDIINEYIDNYVEDKWN